MTTAIGAAANTASDSQRRTPRRDRKKNTAARATAAAPRPTAAAGHPGPATPRPATYPALPERSSIRISSILPRPARHGPHPLRVLGSPAAHLHPVRMLGRAQTATPAAHGAAQVTPPR